MSYKWLCSSRALLFLLVFSLAASACTTSSSSRDVVWSSKDLPEAEGTLESPVLTEVSVRDGEQEGVIIRLRFDSSEVPEPLGKREFNPQHAFPAHVYDGDAKRRLATLFGELATAFKIPADPIAFENHPFIDRLFFKVRNNKVAIVLDVYNDATEEWNIEPEQQLLDIIVHDCTEVDCPPEWDRGL